MFTRRCCRRAHEGGPHGEVGDFSIPRRGNGVAGLALATLPCPVAAACPMRARAMRRGHRVSVAKGRLDRNAGVRVGYGVATMKHTPSTA